MSRGPSRATLDLVWARDGSACFVCGRPLVRGGGGYSVHHRRPRGMGGSRDRVTGSAANLVLLCGSGTDGCHGLVESRRAWALGAGLLLRQSGDPRSVPVRLAGRAPVVLSEVGGLVVVLPELG